MKTRWPTISKSDFVKLLREIKKSYKDLDCKLKIYNKPTVWRRFGTESPSFGERIGYYDISKKRAMVVFFGKIGRAKQLEVILHEMRHAEHHKKGLYKDYYYGDWRRVLFDDEYLPEKGPDLRIALLAEMDCNRFAYYWLKKRGIIIPKDFSYQFDTVATVANDIIKERKNAKK